MTKLLDSVFERCIENYKTGKKVHLNTIIAMNNSQLLELFNHGKPRIIATSNFDSETFDEVEILTFHSNFSFKRVAEHFDSLNSDTNPCYLVVVGPEYRLYKFEL